MYLFVLVLANVVVYTEHVADSNWIHEDYHYHHDDLSDPTTSVPDRRLDILVLQKMENPSSYGHDLIIQY